MSKFKKLAAGAFVAVICAVSFTSPATAPENTATSGSYAEEIVDPFTRLEAQGFHIITSTNTALLSTTDMSDISSHLLLDQAFFSSALSNQSDEIREAIYNGNIIAVFDNSNKNFDYEKTLGLPIGFETTPNTKNSKNTGSDTHKSIGYIYQADELGGIHITRVNTGIRVTSDDEDIHTFANVLLNYEMRETVNSVISDSMRPTEFIGSVADYYYECASEKGEVRVVYEVSTTQNIGGHDYYTIHAYMDATPGRALYGSKYDADILETELRTDSTDAILYNTEPNTMYGSKSYTVDVDIKKNVLSETKCEWIADIDDWSDGADTTFSFEPGGTFRISGEKELSVIGKTTFTVDAWDESPSVAVFGTTIFYCSKDTVEQ